MKYHNKDGSVESVPPRQNDLFDFHFFTLYLIEIGFVFCDWKGWSDPIELARFYFSQGKHEESLTDSEGCETVNGVVDLLGIVSSNSFLCERGKIERERDSDS